MARSSPSATAQGDIRASPQCAADDVPPASRKDTRLKMEVESAPTEPAIYDINGRNYAHDIVQKKERFEAKKEKRYVFRPDYSPCCS